jgi:hypothetical protein
MQTFAPTQGRTRAARPARDLGRELGVGDIGPHHADEVGIARAQNVLGQCERGHPADRRDGNLHGLLHGARQMPKGRKRRGRRRPVIDAGELSRVVARGHAHIVDLAGPHETLGEDRRPLRAYAALDEFVAGDADSDDRVGSHRGSNRADTSRG